MPCIDPCNAVPVMIISIEYAIKCRAERTSVDVRQKSQRSHQRVGNTRIDGVCGRKRKAGIVSHDGVACARRAGIINKMAWADRLSLQLKSCKHHHQYYIKAPAECCSLKELMNKL